MRQRVLAILLVLSAVALVATGCATQAGELTPGVEETLAPGVVPGETEEGATPGVETPEEGVTPGVTGTAPGAAVTESPAAGVTGSPEMTVTGTVTGTMTIMPTGTPTNGG
ncbi:MAG: hypothetical protein GX552_01485 [Chloroflexi bacterium]|nr:hypothetical protein [Chloroflexota bacterium]